ncbi:MAG TPA: DUF445 family protein [Spirochaetota bacterium]|jgi:uncharacterized membrane protein YheB (UPF0754 family)|nr:MAG: hypothetical protein BWX91_00535 [Spirochaetes bacterium ADurb.Bin133]HNZ26935.1 DUF445 family protein [Spirochaetota bacterium]HOE99865.1 DUF445 family protein [Spirochaetota bacterium]HOS31785.1 DUF445 family protein [Spirochaetota bacterium]HOS55181.1 DUF445 family protein [Spirochaetota bacterium]
MELQDILRYVTYPLLGAGLGSMTNWIAITLLFRPRKKILGVQGLLQKRKGLIAVKAAEIIREYLLNTNELKKVMDKDKARTGIDRLVEKTLAIVPRLGRKIFSKALREIAYKFFFDDEGYVKKEILELALNDSDLEKIVVEKISNYDISELERIIKKASGAEINFIIWSGGVLGFFVGLVEVFLPF